MIMDSELVQLLAKYPTLTPSFKQFLIDHHYTTKDSLLTIPTEQNELKNHFANCKEFLTNLQLRRSFQAVLHELSPEAAANEYRSFRETKKQAGGAVGVFNQTAGSPGTSVSSRTTNNAASRVVVEDRKPDQVHTSAARNTQPSQTQHAEKVNVVRTDGQSSRNPYQNTPTPTIVKKESKPAQSSPDLSTGAQRSTGASLPTERIAILGRQTTVGTEYDACTNTYFDSKDNLKLDIKKFTDNENLPEILILPFPQSPCDRLDLIGLNSNQKADFLVGLLENKLAANLANESNGENDEEKVVVRYRVKSHTASRNIATSNYQPKNKGATHIVVGVEYGTEVVFILNEKKVAGQKSLFTYLTEVIERIKRMKETMGIEDRFRKIKCQAFSNSDDYQVTSFYHAAIILHSLMTEIAEQKHIPQTAIILPLQQKMLLLSQETINEIERFTAMNMSTNRFLMQQKTNDPLLSKIVGIDSLDAALKSMCQQVLAMLKKKLICVRYGSEDEKSIAKFLRENHTENNRQAKMVEHTTDAINLFSMIVLSPLQASEISENGTEPKIVLEIGIAPPNQLQAESYLLRGDEEYLKTLFPWMQSFDRQKLEKELKSFVELFRVNKGKEKHFCYRIKTNVQSGDRLFTCFLEERGNRFIVPNAVSGAYINVSSQKITATSIVLQLETGWTWKRLDNITIKTIPCEAQICAIHVDKGTPIQTKKVTIPSDVVFDGLTASTAYSFTMQVAFSAGFTLGKRQLSNNICTIASPAQLMIGKEQQVENELGFYALPKIEVASGTGFRRFQVGSQKIGQPSEKVILLVGGTGSGKSTFINAMANYLYEVGINHPFRLQLITNKDEFNESQSKDKAQSQTKMVSAYELNGTRLPYPVTIVDTPGFGDTEGIDRDKKTMEYIKEWFERHDANSLQTIDAVCTVIKSTETRQTPRAKYELRLVQSLFGKDVRKNMITAYTFCDNQEPLAAQALKGKLVGDVQLKFNNHCFTVLPSNDRLVDMFWKQTSKSFESFFEIIEKFEPQSVIHTLEVLHLRKSLEEQAAMFSKQVPMQIDKMKEIENVINQLKSGDYVLTHTQNFKIKRKKFVQVQVPIKNGVFTTYCKKCLFTCHEDCKEVKGEDKMKFNCDVMNVKDVQNAHCTICPKKCTWSDHVHANFIAKQVESEEEDTAGQVLQEYQMKMEAQQSAESLLELLAIDLLEQDKILGDTITSIRETLNRLSEISLRPGLTTDSKYLLQLIEQEKQDKQQGSEERVAVLYRHLKIVKLLEDEQEPDGRLHAATESVAVAYLGHKFPTLYKKLALKGYFKTNAFRADNKSASDEATLKQIERNYPVEYQNMRKNPSAKLSETSSKAVVVECFKRTYPSITAAAMRTLKEEADVDSLSGEKTPSEHTVDAELVEQNRRIEEITLHDNDKKLKKANTKVGRWKRIKKTLRR